MARTLNHKGEPTISRRRLQTMFAQAARETRSLLGTDADYFLVHDEQGNALHLSPFKHGKLPSKIAEEFNRTILETSAKNLKLCENFGSQRVIAINELSAFVLGLNLHEIQITDTPRHQKPIYNAWYIYDHEEAHTLIDNARSNTPGSRHFKETIADTYAILRHIQRFGKHTDFPAFQAQLAATMLVNNSNYYTSDAISAVVTLANTLPIENLSRRMTLELAEAIATQYQVEEKTLIRIAAAFHSLDGKVQYTKEDFAGVALIFPDDKEIQKACALASKYLEATSKNGSTPAHRTNINKKEF